MKLRIAILGVIIIGIFLARFVLNRIDARYKETENNQRVMYLLDSADVKIRPEGTADILYRLNPGDSALIRYFDPHWKEIDSGGYLPDSVLTDLRPE